MQKSENPFKKRYQELPGIEMIPTRDRIIERCGISIPTFYVWLRGESDPPKPSKEIIADELKTSVKKLFPNN